MVAPTHKAVGVLRHHLGRAALQPTWYPSTIHRLLRLRLKREGDRERCEETEQTAAALEHLGLVLVDEASMVDSTLLEISLRCAHPFGTRLVFVGDPAQLPPVGEPCSPVFSLGRARRAALTEVVRHQGPVLQLAQGIREERLPARQPPALPPVRTALGEVALLPRAVAGRQRPRTPCAAAPPPTIPIWPASSVTRTAPWSSWCRSPAAPCMAPWPTSCRCCPARC